MKTTLFGTLLILSSFTALAQTPTGLYKIIGEPKAPMFKSFEVNSSECEQGGFKATFFEAYPAFNFCTGYFHQDEYEDKKCLGKEIKVYPFIKKCIGVKVTEIYRMTTEVVNSGNTYSQIKKNFRDDTLLHEEEIKITDLGNGKATIQHTFQNIDGRTGDELYSYEK